jgi:Spy/CpxP family protein refolding chaperone
MKRFATIITLAAIVLIGATAHAEPGRHGSHRGGHRLQQALGLSDQQAQSIKQIRQRDAEASKQLFQMLHQARVELRRLAVTGADDAAIRAKQTEVHELTGQALERRTATLKEIATVLTPEQREKFASMTPHGRRHGEPRGQRS